MRNRDKIHFIKGINLTKNPYETRPLKDYEKPKSKSGKLFPNCCPYHKSILVNLKRWFESLKSSDILCNYIGYDWYSKKEYRKLPHKIVTQLSYTEHHIEKQINSTDWYNDITEYIAYNIDSLGIPAIGKEQYLHYVKLHLSDKGWLEESKIPFSKAEQILEFIELEINPPANDKREPTNLETLFETYEKWLGLFPFEISLIKNLRETFEKQIPVFNGKAKRNRYSGIVTVKAHSQSSLTEALYNLTKILLDTISIPEMRKKWQSTEVEFKALEFADAALKIEAAEITKKFSEGELRYVDALKKWLQIHDQYFTKNKEILKALTMPTSKKGHVTKAKKQTRTHLTFENIFSDKDYKKYINALVEVENPVLDSEWKFIGQPKKHKGVICSWIKHLQTTGKIKGRYNRSQLSRVLNHEIGDLNLGKDGKTFDNFSLEYRDNYEKKLIEIINTYQ